MSTIVPDQLPAQATVPPLMDDDFIVGQLVKITGQIQSEVSLLDTVGSRDCACRNHNVNPRELAWD